MKDPPCKNGVLTLAFTAALRSIDPTCGPNERYGTSLSRISCLDAWKKIPRTKDKIVFGRRGDVLKNGFTLPFRFLSDDGRCAIDIVLGLEIDVREVDLEAVDGLTISDTAGAILVKCVNDFQKGGSAGLPSKHLYSQIPFIE